MSVHSWMWQRLQWKCSECLQLLCQDDCSSGKTPYFIFFSILNFILLMELLHFNLSSLAAVKSTHYRNLCNETKSFQLTIHQTWLSWSEKIYATYQAKVFGNTWTMDLLTISALLLLSYLSGQLWHEVSLSARIQSNWNILQECFNF